MACWHGTLAAFARNQAGHFALLFALLLPALIGAMALVVDEAAVYHDRRLLQSGVDLAAIYAMGDLSAARERARLALADARLASAPDDPGLVVETGVYTPDAGLPVGRRFVSAASPANAVRVRMTRPGQLYFFRALFAPPSLSTSAVASATPRAAFSIGSRLASLDGGLPAALLNGLLGLGVSANLVDYRNLAGVDIGLFGLLDGLATRMSLSAGTYSELLSGNIALSDLARAMAGVLAADNAAASAEASLLAGLISPALRVRGDRLIGLGELGGLAIGTGGSALAANIGALELIGVAGALANGRNQAALSVATGVPLVGSITLELAVGEPAQGGSWFAVGGVGTVVRTAQVRMRLVAAVGTGSVGLLANRVLHVPLYFELAPASARLAALACPPGRPEQATVTIAATPGIARLTLGEISPAALADFSAQPVPGQATLLNVLGLVRITGRGTVAIAEPQPVDLAFTAPDIAAGTVRTARVSAPIGSLTGSLLDGLELSASPLGLLNALLGPTYEALVGIALIPLAPPVDAILAAVLDLLGLRLGEADVRLHGIDCRHAVLVQ